MLTVLSSKIFKFLKLIIYCVIYKNFDHRFSNLFISPLKSIFLLLITQSCHIRMLATTRTFSSALTEPVDRCVPNPAKPILIDYNVATVMTNYLYFFHILYLLKLYFYCFLYSYPYILFNVPII